MIISSEALTLKMMLCHQVFKFLMKDNCKTVYSSGLKANTFCVPACLLVHTFHPAGFNNRRYKCRSVVCRDRL